MEQGGAVSVVVTKVKKKKANSVPKERKKLKARPPARETMKDGTPSSPSSEKKKKKAKKKVGKKSASTSTSPSSSLIKHTSAIRGNTWMEVYQQLKERVWQDKTKEEWKALETKAVNRAMEGSLEKKTKVASSPKNKTKNRYATILPYDDNRIKLSKDIDGSDYINASLLTTSGVLKMKHPTRYVAASAPLPNTLEHWYRMIWELDIVIIVMLTQCMEGNKEKCTKYWPEERDELKFGSIVVKNIREETNEQHSWVTRALTVTCDGQTKTVVQFHFLAWPDHGVPTSTEALEAVIHSVDEKHKELRPSKESPLLVHCSAGVGRTGTFIVIQSLFHLIEQSMKKTGFTTKKDSGSFLGRSVSCDNARDSDIIRYDRFEDEEDDWTLQSKFGSIIASNKRLSDNPSPGDLGSSRDDSEVELSGSGKKKKKQRPPPIHIKRLVQHIRDQRASMLTRPEQYEFCYKSLLSFVAKKLGIPPVDYQGVGHLLAGTTVIALRPRKLFVPSLEAAAKMAPSEGDKKTMDS